MVLLAAETDSHVERASGSSLGYMPGLDVVRGLAIAMVVVYHGLTPHVWVFASYPHTWAVALRVGLRMGFMGVQLFFVLSGFLITGVLVESRDRPEYFKNFYVRRALRILPAYVLMLAVLRVTHAITWMYVLVSLLYFCNMGSLFGVRNEYGPLWSLSVEEQFYLVWPLVVRRTSRRQLACVCIGVLIATPMLRFGLLYGPAFLQDIRYKTWAMMDFFAAGGAIAIAARSSVMREKLRWAVVPLLAGGGIFFVALVWIGLPANEHAARMVRALTPEPWLVMASGLLLLAVLRPEIAKSVLARPLIFLGNISYGLYLCHQFLFYLVDAHWHLSAASSVGLMAQLLLRFSVEAMLAVAIATVSRYTIEEFFLRLKPKHKAVTLNYSVATKIT